MNKIVALGALLAGLVCVPADASSPPQPLKVDERLSQVEIRVKATAHSFTARLKQFRSQVMVDTADGLVTAAYVTFHIADVSTGIQSRDRAMQEWEETTRFPDGDFSLSTLTPAGGGHFVAHGRLTLHGITREVVFPVSITTDRIIYAVDGEVELDTQDYGLPKIRKLGVLRVDSNLTVRFHLQGTVKTAKLSPGSLPDSTAGNKML